MIRLLAGGAVVRPFDSQYGIGRRATGFTRGGARSLGTDAEWLLNDLDTYAYAKVPAAVLLEKLVNVSPEVSRAYWDYLLMTNPGWSYKLKPAGAEGGANTDAELTGPPRALVDNFFQVLKDNHGTVDVVFDRLNGAGFLRGGYFAELILDRDGKTFIDLATPDPAVIRWQRQYDELRGLVWDMGQWDDNHEWYSWRGIPTIRFIPIHPLPDKPEGRAPAGPAIYTALYTLVILHESRRVLQQQGWPRIDLMIDLEKLKAAMPVEAQNDPAEFNAWVETLRLEVNRVYGNLKPDQAYIHSSVVTVGRPVGAIDSSSLGALGGIIAYLERQIIRALKTLPLLMGTADVSGDAGIRQWEIYTSSIKSMQHRCESLIEYMVEQYLRANGYIAKMEFRFSELRASEMLRDQAVLQLRLANARLAYDNGLITQDDQAQMALDRPLAAEPEPRVAKVAGIAPQPNNLNSRGERAVFKPTGATDLAPSTKQAPFTKEEIDTAVAVWDQLVPQWAGMLDAAAD